MRAMILAAGRGARMGALTETTPKPLLKVGDKFLIEYSLLSLVKIGVQDIIINVSYHAEQIKSALGNGQRYGVNIHYSEEPEVLETGGGVLQALPLLGAEPFIVLSSDIICDYPLEQLPKTPKGLAHLVMVSNPDFNPRGDFTLAGSQLCAPEENNTLTFGNISVFRPELLAGFQPGKFRLTSVFNQAIANQQLTGEHYTGFWHNVGTAEQLNAVSLYNYHEI